MRYLRAFGAFWYDFLIGDRPELFVGLDRRARGRLARDHAGLSATLAGGLLVVLILLLGGLSIWAARGRSP